MWNELVMVINYNKVSQEDKNHARLLLRQLDTAGGAYFLKKEITYFLEDMYEKYGNIPKITLKQKLINLKNDYEKYKKKPIKGLYKLDGFRWANVNDKVCADYELRIKALEGKIKNLK